MNKTNLLSLVLLIFFGCNSRTPGIESNEATSTVVTTQYAAITPTITLKAWEIEEITPSPTIPSITLQSLPYSPTFEPEVSIDMLAELLLNNGGCEIPCWWGIIPGETLFLEAWKTLQPLARNDDFFPPSHHTRIPQYLTTIVFFFEIPSEYWEREPDHYPYSIELVVNDETLIVERIWAEAGDNNPRFAIPEILSNFGKPEEILINKERLDTHRGRQFISLYMYYPEMGVTIKYQIAIDLPYGPIIHACFDKKNIMVGMWDHSLKISRKEALIISNSIPIESSFWPVDEVSDLSVEEFYIKFNKANRPVCIEIFTNNWIQ